MKSRLLLLVVSLSVLVACGGGSSSSTTTNSAVVSLSPSTASVPVNTTAQFTATVSNSSSGVYWLVNGVIGGGLATGTISVAGLYSAPAVIPSPATVTITATSLTDSTQSSTATVTVTAGTALSFTIAPSAVSIYTSRTQQFTATFNVSANTGVTWEVNSTIGGDATHGTISSTGLYTAPATVPSPAAVTITAISQSDPTKTVTAQVTVVLGTTIVVLPIFATVPAGATQAFTATANSQPLTVTWTLNCNSTQTGGCGSITSAGVYTAPSFPPPGGGAVAITATSTDQSALPAGANVVVQISNGSLVGNYAFSFAGKNSGTAYASAGSITFDGGGNITGGSEDVNAVAATSLAITGGTYHIGIDGRGNATVQTSGGTETWQIVIKDNTKAFVMRADAGTTGSGTLYLQDVTKFAIGSVNGNYALQLSGPAAGQTGSAAIAGAFAANGAGGISGGKLDASAGTTVSTALSANGLYTAPAAATGRGTLTLASTYGTQNFAYYLVDATRAVLVETDAGKILRGDLVKQPAGPFTLASFAGSYAMVVSGSNTQGPLALGAIFTLDGAGSVSSGVADVNANGNVQNQVVLAGTYLVTDATTGRSEATVSINGQARKFVLYPESGSVNTVLEIDGVQTTIGRAYLQASNVSMSLFQGSYVTNLVGTDFINSPGEEDAVGIFTPNGGSALTGTLDVNDNGAIARNATVQASYLGSTAVGRAFGPLTTSSSTLSSAQFVYYVVDANRALVLENDSSRVLVGVMEKP